MATKPLLEEPDHRLDAAAEALRAEWAGSPYATRTPWADLDEHHKDTYRRAAQATLDAAEEAG